MKYTETSCQAILPLIEKIRLYLLEKKNVKISDLERIEHFLQNAEHKKITGSLSLVFSSQTRRESDGCVTSLEETVSFSKSGFVIRSFSQEDFYGEYYTNNEFRVDTGNSEKFLSDYVNAAADAIFMILEANNGLLEVVSNKFYTIIPRIKS